MPWGNSLKYQATNISSQEGIYRAAFPACRVFIYGQEVSGDVIEVRVNQSGGSMDRSPGTCSITLANMADKYILDHYDMLALASSRDRLVATLAENVLSYVGAAGSQMDSAGEDAKAVYEFMQLMSDQGRFDQLYISVEDFYEGMKTLQGVNEGDWIDGKVPDLIKMNVITQKANQTIPNWNKFYEEKKDDPMYQNLFEGGSTIKYIYPLTEGDCIFHPNDPIRIAFRDPFTPSVWYWMFAGFVDGFVEDRGVNQESVVTISGTDVTKIARYSFFQLNTNAVLDPALSAVFPVFQNSVTSTPFVPYQELFANFSIYEMLEMLFFGMDSYRGTLSSMTEWALSFMSDAEANVYLQHTSSGLSLAEIEAMKPTEKTSRLKEYLEGAKTQRFIGAQIPPLSTPRGDVQFQRKDDTHGVHALFVGASQDTLEVAMGGEQVNVEELRKINDYLHHRVTTSDPSIMGVNSTAKRYESPTMTPSDIITHIGRNFEDYPVGGGRVFYVAPAGLTMGTASGVMNEILTGAGGGLHSEFKDRLTFLYDVAEQIQFCFYATPRGDVVFEMPFYDFDPWMFDYDSSFVTNADVQDATSIVRESIDAWAKNSSKYTEEEVYRMMQLSSNLSLLSEGFSSTNLEDMGAMDYAAYFTIDKHETYGFSNAVDDNGLKTVGRCTPKNIARQGEEINSKDTRQTQFVIAPELASLLGFRPASEKSPWTEVVSDEGARIFAALDLRRSNSEARSLNLQIIPHFGLMVNRPLYWRQRNYVANIVSCQHSMAINSSCETQISVNYARGWKGEYQQGSSMEMFRHFGGDMPFSYAALLSNKRSYTGDPPKGVKDPDAFS